jgi:N-acyl-D-aspartate/D-glutamate deacylase
VLDTLIAGGTVVDGTGRPARQVDVGISQGRIAYLSAEGPGPEPPARRRVDAAGLVVAPGVVDIHTHYDAQLFWDPSASPSPLHGTTTVIGGNCGFTLAPAGEAHADYLMRMMARVEGMPLEALAQGLAWDWEEFPDWLGRLEGRLGPNAGFLVGHSALRRAVMGEGAVGQAAGEDEVAAMASLLHQALEAGGLGFSSSQAPTHNDGSGDPVPSRAADRREMLALASVVADHPGTTLELILAGCLNGFSDEEVDLMAAMSLAGGRPLNWNVLGVSAANRAGVEHQLGASSAAAERGAQVVALTLPHPMSVRLSFATGFVLDGLPGWRQTFALPVPERIKALSDPEVRRRLAEGAASPEAGVLRALSNWSRLTIVETFAPENRRFEFRTVGEVAAERGQEPFDALLDLVIADELRTGLSPSLREDPEDWKLRAEVWRDERALIGGSDAGAHLDMMCGAQYSTWLLGEGVRERQLICLEEAVRQLSDRPARLYGLAARGRIAEGWWADLFVFDPERVGPRPTRTRYDLPGGAPRLYAEAEGVCSVMVAGTEVVADGALTGATPGRLIRSGRDTETVGVPGRA